MGCVASNSVEKPTKIPRSGDENTTRYSGLDNKGQKEMAEWLDACDDSNDVIQEDLTNMIDTQHPTLSLYTYGVKYIPKADNIQNL